MKLTKNKLLETIRRKNQGWTTYQARKIAGISIRRVNQVWGEYNETGKTPEIGNKNVPLIPLIIALVLIGIIIFFTVFKMRKAKTHHEHKEQKKHCTKYGAKIKPDDSYCEKCGKKIK